MATSRPTRSEAAMSVNLHLQYFNHLQYTV